METMTGLTTAAMEYASYGWKIVPLHNLTEAGGCSCSAGRDCPTQSRGKHPRLSEWQKSASSEEEQLVAWWEEYPQANIGVLLGPRSGIIDIEFDDLEGRNTADELLKGTVTPTYQSGRSTHRLFKWSEEFPRKQKSMIRGLEVRLGGGDKAAQSVLPPSAHPSGMTYFWMTELAASQVEPADVPDIILALLWNNEGGDLDGKGGKTDEEWKKILQGSDKGSRNDDITSIIGKLFHESKDITSKSGIEFLWGLVLVQNGQNRPPLDERELKAAFLSILKKEQQKRIAVEIDAEIQLPPEQRLEPAQGGPRGMRIVIEQSEPRIYRLYAPYFAKAKRGDGGYIELTAAQICNPLSIRVEALEQAEYPISSSFAKKWCCKDGLFERLVFACDYTRAAAERKRAWVVAERLSDCLRDRRKLQEGEKLDARGWPAQLAEKGVVVFKFSTIWESMKFSADKITRLELSKLLERCGAKVYWSDHQRYKSMDPKALHKLDAIIKEPDLVE